MGYFIGAMIPIVVIVGFVYFLCTDVKDECESKKELDKWAKRNEEMIFGKKF